jgi:putative transposase
MPHCRLFYHVVWATKNRQQWIIQELESVLFNSIRSKAIGLGAKVYAVNACLDHVHLVVSIPPSISISRFIGQVKGVSSLKINRSNLLSCQFQWQSEYGIFSIDESQLPECISYVERQKTHHFIPKGINPEWET